MDNRQTILAISPGTSLLGFAVLRHGVLVDYGVKAYMWKWSKGKSLHIANSVKKLTEQYAPETVVIKVADIASPSKNVELIVAGIEEMAEKKGAKVFKCALQDIKQACCNGEDTAEELYATLMKQYPELSFIEKLGLNGYFYYGKMFEALGAIIYYLSEI
ncbi:MAG TPA: hypothetical protein VK809_04380 [Bacteroidia bacterium]|jgi:hypothetical protein|nr:hypothetical protein [Bacteroidia bacterium]